MLLYNLFSKYYLMLKMTHLQYLEDTYQFLSEAKILEIKETDKGLALILDQTIFYPQGGGQPADHGVITSATGKFIVTDVRLDPSGIVYHFGDFAEGNFAIGTTVNLQVEQNRRVLNARLHSAGHLIDVAAKKVGFDLNCVKSYHFPDGPYLEYEGMVENSDHYLQAIEKMVNDLMAENLVMLKRMVPAEEAKAKGLFAPEGKQVRVVSFSGYNEVGCGGTHVENSGEIGEIIIKKVSPKKGCTRIVYDVANA